MSKKFYITTTLPYVNAEPHIGHAMEFVRADVIARFKRYLGYEVFFNTGTDEHGQKIYEASQKENSSPKDYVDKYAKRFIDFCQLTNISYDGFLRTTEERHIRAAQKMWNIAKERGDIYKAKQKIHYCVGCEMEKTASELVDDKCPDHPNRELLITEEENYFFRFSKYEKDLLKLYERGLVKPDFRQNEIYNFVSSGLKDFSVSRLKSKMPWGVPVPDDHDHVMYVWFDALNSYISTLGWGSDEKNFSFWTEGEVVQYCGKDNNKAQSAIWQAMLLSSGLKNTDIININGHIISGGMKMSKSVGNVISPFEIIEKFKKYTLYPEEVLRFILCHEVSTYEDSDITKESIDLAYITHLQNGLGNQVNRILKLSNLYLNNIEKDEAINKVSDKLDQDLENYLNNFLINEAIKYIFEKQKKLDEYIQFKEPFKLVKQENTLQEGKEIIADCLKELFSIANMLVFFMPKTSNMIKDLILKNKMPDTPLFARLND